MSDTAYEELINSDSFQKEVNAEFASYLNNKGPFFEAALEAEGRKLAAENIAKGDAVYKGGVNDRDIGYIDFMSIDEGVQEKLFKEYGEKEAAKKAAQMESPFKPDEPGLERNAGGMLKSIALAEAVERKIAEEGSGHTPVFNPKRVYGITKRCTQELLFEMKVNSKINSLSEEQKTEIINERKESCFSADPLEYETEKKCMRDFVNNPENKNIVAQMYLDGRKAQGLLKEMKKAGKETPHIDDVYNKVKKTRVKQEEKDRKEKEIQDMKQARVGKNMAMMEAVKKKLGLQK